MSGDRVDWDALCQHREVEQLTNLAIAEDLGTGDLTTDAIFSESRIVEGRIVARTPTVVCGIPLIKHILLSFDAEAMLEQSVPEGSLVKAGTTIATIKADVRALLKAERCMLNFLMRLCGIAYGAHQVVAALPIGVRAEIYDTRKTMPGWRQLDKAAVATGGARNHRFGLYDAVLIKDNHIAAAQSLTDAVKKAQQYTKGRVPIEVEVDTLGQLDEAIAAKADIVLIDNFSETDMKTAVERAGGRLILEASGGVTCERIAAIARTGVDRISLGSLTHSVIPPDIGLDMD
ncbi:MAG: nicotinate-nucleotide diphosphorylase (carboxylating) [Deltaproteobacteria bacterium RIFOXYA12_FULL_58_15]|nr:MAG: nicotinate-nucleotide diphosphorylase (carboxylating) [Deltaproteobacteria bacterium RIFOXYA12_FULL_58_15]OGR14744.1 MAG: nicotinate-nucleotide diphosphorylase (carboxylating) [Deltaproteobacteria bacterium RIFOXYB12_FULL_58_9]